MTTEVGVIDSLDSEEGAVSIGDVSCAVVDSAVVGQVLVVSVSTHTARTRGFKRDEIVEVTTEVKINQVMASIVGQIDEVVVAVGEEESAVGISA